VLSPLVASCGLAAAKSRRIGVVAGWVKVHDVKLGPLANPAATDSQLRAIPGVVETGLFCQRAQRVLVEGADGVRALEPPALFA